MNDSRGVKSTTLSFVAVSWLAVTGKFISGTAGWGPEPFMTATEYGTAVALILGIWLGREYTEKVAGK